LSQPLILCTLHLLSLPSNRKPSATIFDPCLSLLQSINFILSDRLSSLWTTQEIRAPGSPYPTLEAHSAWGLLVVLFGMASRVSGILPMANGG
jgi:hypothetical protein